MGRQNYTSRLFTLCLLLLSSLFSVQIAFGASADMAVDRQMASLAVTSAPSVSITSPTSSGSFSSTVSNIAIGGTASDDVGVTAVTWLNSTTGQSGNCLGTSSWTASGIILSPGVNIITVTASDADGNVGTASLNVTFSNLGENWWMFHHDRQHSGRSPYPGPVVPSQKWLYSPNWVGSSPAVGPDGTVYVGSEDHKLYAITPNGYTRWVFTTGDKVRSAPAINYDGTIYFGSYDGSMYALTSDGKYKWEFDTNGAVFSSPAIGPDGTVYIGSFDQNLYAVNPDGTKKWSFATGGGVESSPAVGADGTVYVGSDDGSLYAVNPDGTLKWKAGPWVAVDGSPAIGSDGTIYIGAYDGNLHALNPDGTEKWAYSLGNVVDASPAVGSDGTIYAAAGANLYAINPDGTEKWHFTTAGSSIESSPAVDSDGVIYIGSDNNLYAINPDGTQKWDFVTSYNMVSSPAIGPDRTIYAGMYAIGPIPVAVTITSPTSAPTYTTSASTITLSGTALSHGNIIAVTWSNAASGQTGTCTGTTSWSATDIPLAAGTNVITITAEDDLGGRGTDKITVNPAGSAIPTVVITTPNTDPFSTKSSRINIGGKVTGDTDVTGVTWSNAANGKTGKCVGTTSWSARTVPLSPGSNVITITASDAAGNRGTATFTALFNYTDTYPPHVNITAPADASTYGTNNPSLSISGTASDNVGVTEVTWTNNQGGGGVCIGTTSWSASGITLKPGINVITVTALDAANNSSSTMLTVTYYDTTSIKWNAGMNMISIPVIPSQNDPKSVVQFDGNSWYAFEPSQNQYAAYPDTSTWFNPVQSAPGRGFWSGFAGDTSVPTGEVPDQTQPVTIHLLPGWNIIGQPYISPVKWDLQAIKVQMSGQSPVSLASSRGIVSPNAWGWNGTSGSYYMVYDSSVMPGVVDTLAPWQGYWIRAYQECDLILPPTGS